MDFAADYLRPFVLYVLSEIRKVSPESLLFFKDRPPVGHPPPWRASDPGGVVHAGHFYDGMALMGKHYDPDFTIDQSQMMPVFGRDAVRTAYVDQIRAPSQHLPDIPFLLGEFGIPFDLDGGHRTEAAIFPPRKRRWMAICMRLIKTCYPERCGTTRPTMTTATATTGTVRICRSTAAIKDAIRATSMTEDGRSLPSSDRMRAQPAGLRLK